MDDDGLIFFDLTQLVLRVVIPTPSGIGRVEFAYAKYMLERYPEKVKFVFALPQILRVIPNRLAARYIDAMHTIWVREDGASNRLENKIQGRLSNGAVSHDLDVLRKVSGYSNRLRRQLLSVDLLLNVVLNFGLTPDLSYYSRSRKKHAYISVSNSIIAAKSINNWLLKSPSVAGIFLLHDLIPITNPEFTITRNTIRHKRYLYRLTKTANCIITNSIYTYDCLKQYAATEQLTLPNVVISPLGVDRSFLDARVARVSEKPYFVFTATIEPRKNHIMLLQVWQRLVAKLGPETPKLLLVGRRGWENENTLDLIERASALQNYVIECGNVPDSLLIKLMAGARAALFPSHVEGYGLPLAEALALGVPVICSDIPPFKEIAGDIAEYVDPLAGRGWLKLIAEYAAADSPKRAAQIARLRRFKPHTWEDHLSVLDSVLQRAGIVKEIRAVAPARGHPGLQHRGGVERPGLVARAASTLWRRACNLAGGARPPAQVVTEHDLNTMLATRLGRGRSDADLNLILRERPTRSEVMASFRGLRCAILGKVADSPDAGALLLEAARARINLGIAHIVIAVVYPLPLREVELSGLSGAVDRARLNFVIITEAGESPWLDGGVKDLAAELRSAHELLVRDETLQQAVSALNIGLVGVSRSLIGDRSACDRLVRTLGIGDRDHASAPV